MDLRSMFNKVNVQSLMWQKKFLETFIVHLRAKSQLLMLYNHYIAFESFTGQKGFVNEVNIIITIKLLW